MAKERGIIMSAPMVLALLEGRKTQTRRVLKPQLVDYDFGRGGIVPAFMPPQITNGFMACGLTRMIKDGFAYHQNPPYGVVGDRLWVRETFARCHPGLLQKLDPDPQSSHWFHLYRADGVSSEYIADYGVKWSPSIFMPRLASRVTLEITGVRVERLQEITEEDAKAEGVDSIPQSTIPRQATWTRRQAYAQLWDSLHGKGAWELNPWVWVLEFKRV